MATAKTRTRTRARTAQSKEMHLQFAMVYFWAAGLLILGVLISAILVNLMGTAATTDTGSFSAPLQGSLSDANRVASFDTGVNGAAVGPNSQQSVTTEGSQPNGVANLGPNQPTVVSY
jgi:hypothetical protein